LNRHGTLYSYVQRCGAVAVARGGLTLLAMDLCICDRDMASLIAQMAQCGQAAEVSNVLRFSARRQCVPKLGDCFPICLCGMAVAA
jgi:hypothetical protein